MTPTPSVGPMAHHHVEAQLQAHQVAFWDLLVTVSTDGRKFGSLLVSQDSVDWKPRSSKTTYRLSWERFEELVKEHGRPTRNQPVPRRAARRVSTPA
jgi:hypothetical protein